MFQSVLDLISEFLKYLSTWKQADIQQQQTDQAGAVQTSTQQEQVIQNAALAQKLRDQTQRDLAANPGSLFDDDGFERK